MKNEGSETWRLILEHVDDWRAQLNASCSHLEAWQISSYTLSLVFLILYMLEVSSSDRPILDRIKARLFYVLRTLPWVHRRLQEDLSRAKKEMEEEVHQFDQSREFYKFIPERGLSRDEIIADAVHYSSMGPCRKRLGEEGREGTRKDVVQEVSCLFGYTNPRDDTVFPGSRKMEAEVVRMAISLFHGGTSSSGLVVPSGAEATLVALHSARVHSSKHGVRFPTVIASQSAAPSLFHAAKLLGMRVKKIACKKDGTIEGSSVKRAITSDTAIICVSAPNHSTGTMDPIDAIARIAQRYSIPLHVDCLLGGFIFPFLELCDLPAPSSDFRLPGVTSISIDFSKYGQCPSMCALTLFRDREMLKGGLFSLPEWPGGIYCSPSLSDSLDGSAIASAWATLLSKGKEGFVDATQRLVQATKRVAQAIEELDGVSILGSADTVIVAFETDRPDDVYYVIQVMRSKGWPIDPLVQPPAARINIVPQLNDDVLFESFVDDLDTTLVHLRNNPQLGESCASRAFHHLIRTAPDRWLVRELAAERTLAHYSIPVPLEGIRAMRTLSVDGRKTSFISGPTNDLLERKRREVLRDLQRD